MEQNNVRKYLLYALGEIALVMVGILLALQVNNWNEERKSRIEEDNFLRNIISEVKIDTTKIRNNLALINEIDENAVWLRSQLDTKAPYTSKMDTAFAMISIFSINEPNYTVFDNLQNLGVSLIKNEALRNEILHYYTEFRELAEVDEYFEINKFFRQEIYPKYFKRYRYGSYAIPTDKEAIYENSEISVVLDYCINDAGFYRGRLSHMEEVAVHLISLIEDELD